MSIYYLYSPEGEERFHQASVYLATQGVEFKALKLTQLDQLSPSEGSHLLVSASIYGIKQVLHYAEVHGMSVGIVPLANQRELMDTFALGEKLEASIDLALQPSEKKIDLLYCDAELVLQEVIIGHVPPLDNFSSSLERKGVFQRLRSFVHLIKRMKRLRHQRFVIRTAKEKLLRFCAVGAVGVEYNNQTFASKLISEHLKYNDGRLSLVILSPRSILNYMGYIFQTHILNQTPKKLPSSVGYIHSKSLEVEAEDRQLPVTIDGDRSLQTPIRLETHERALALSVGEPFWERCIPSAESKESVKVAHLPADDEVSAYLSRRIPLFTHASHERFSALFSNLREESSLSVPFVVLLILATMIALLGLYINSASVIIGAMLLAPLMQPIVGVSMGLLRQDSALFFSGLRSISVGVLLVMVASVVLAWILPIEPLTPEMKGRLSPTILDLFVAIISGVAAAYAKSNEKIVGSLAGVSIAVALVPPLVVSGIGLGWGAWEMFGLALLLFITNLVGIILAAALTFLVLGFSPIHVAKKGIFYALLSVGVVSVPLGISFAHMRHNIEVQQVLSDFHTTLGDKQIYLRNILFQGQEVRCEVVASDILSKEEKEILKQRIAKRVGEEIQLLVSFWYAL